MLRQAVRASSMTLNIRDSMVVLNLDSRRLPKSPHSIYGSLDLAETRNVLEHEKVIVFLLTREFML